MVQAFHSRNLRRRKLAAYTAQIPNTREGYLVARLVHHFHELAILRSANMASLFQMILESTRLHRVLVHAQAKQGRHV